MKTVWKSIGATALLVGLASCGGSGDKPKGSQEVNFSILATESSENLMPKWQPFLDDMRRMTGLDIKPFFADDYAGLIEAMRFNRVQVGWFSNKSGLEAINRAQGIPVRPAVLVELAEMAARAGITPLDAEDRHAFRA